MTTTRTQQPTTPADAAAAKAVEAAAAHPAPTGAGPAGARLIDMPLAQLTQAVAEVTRGLDAVRALLPHPSRLTKEQRKHSIGRLKNGESAALQIVADLAAQPAYAPFVACLAERDFGVDPGAFEAPLLKERLERVDALAPVLDQLTALQQDTNDTVRELQALAREPLLQAYAILKSVSKSDPRLAALLRDVTDFYAASAKAAVKTKKTKKATRAAAPAAPPPLK